MKIFELVSDENVNERDWHQMVPAEEEEKEKEDERIVEVLHGFYSL